jgi:hypothetical protein
MVVVVPQAEFYAAVRAGGLAEFQKIFQLKFKGQIETVKIIAKNIEFGKILFKMPLPKVPAVNIPYNKAFTLLHFFPGFLGAFTAFSRRGFRFRLDLPGKNRTFDRFPREFVSKPRFGTGSILGPALSGFFHQFTGNGFLFPVEDGRGFFIVFPLFEFPDNAFLFHHAFETFDGLLQHFVVVNDNMSHCKSPPFLKGQDEGDSTVPPFILLFQEWSFCQVPAWR